MKKCAYCGRSNEDSAVICRECGEELAAASVPDPEPKSVDPKLSPIIVAAFSSLPRAKLLVDRLEAAGIEAFIPEEYGAQIFSDAMPLEPLTVRVVAKDYEAAKALAVAHVAATLKGAGSVPLDARQAAPSENAAAQTGEKQAGTEGTNQELLNELQRLRAVNQRVFWLVLVLAGITLLTVPYRSRRTSGEAHSWDQVSAAMRRGDSGAGLSLAQSLTARQPEYYWGHAYLGSIYLAQNDLTNAEAEYSLAYELFPTEENEKNLAAIRKRLAAGLAKPLMSK